MHSPSTGEQHTNHSSLTALSPNLTTDVAWCLSSESRAGYRAGGTLPEAGEDRTGSWRYLNSTRTTSLPQTELTSLGVEHLSCLCRGEDAGAELRRGACWGDLPGLENQELVREELAEERMPVVQLVDFEFTSGACSKQRHQTRAERRGFSKARLLASRDTHVLLPKRALAKLRC